VESLFGSLHRGMSLASQALGPMQTSVLGDHSPAVKWLGHVGDRSTRSSTEVKNAWMSTATPPHTFMAGTGIMLGLS
jgi:hypothetical protein